MFKRRSVVDRWSSQSERFDAKFLKQQSLGRGKKPVTKIVVLCDSGKLMTLCGAYMYTPSWFCAVAWRATFCFESALTVNCALAKRRVLTLVVSVRNADGCIDVLGCESLDKLSATPSQAKGVTALCIDSRYAQCRVAVQAAKKRLYLYEFVSNAFKPVRELALPEALTALVWHGSSLFLAYGAAYELIDVQTAATTPLFALAPKAKPLMRVLEGELFLANDTIGMIVDFAGQPTRTPLQLSECPLAVAFQFPYVITLQANGLEVLFFN